MKITGGQFTPVEMVNLNRRRVVNLTGIYSLSTIRNLSALKYLIVDLKYKVPKEIFIDGTVILNSYGYKSLKEILENDEFVFKDSEYTEKAKKEILAYLNENKD